MGWRKSFNQEDHKQWEREVSLGELYVVGTIDWIPSDFRGYEWSVVYSASELFEDLDGYASGAASTLVEAKRAAGAAVRNCLAENEYGNISYREYER